jgi:hypothetical protein
MPLSAQSPEQWPHIGISARLDGERNHQRADDLDTEIAAALLERRQASERGRELSWWI